MHSFFWVCPGNWNALSWNSITLFLLAATVYVQAKSLFCLLFFLFCLKSYLIWSGNTLHFVAREYSVCTTEYCVLTCGIHWLVMLIFWNVFLCLTSEKVLAKYRTSYMKYRWLVAMLGVPKCFYLITVRKQHTEIYLSGKL